METMGAVQELKKITVSMTCNSETSLCKRVHPSACMSIQQFKCTNTAHSVSQEIFGGLVPSSFRIYLVVYKPLGINARTYTRFLMQDSMEDRRN